MDVAATATQQAIIQSKIGISMVKSQHQAEQAIVDLIAATVDGARGKNLNITV